MTNQDHATYTAIGAIRAIVMMRRSGAMSAEAALIAIEAEVDAQEFASSRRIDWRAAPYRPAGQPQAA